MTTGTSVPIPGSTEAAAAEYGVLGVSHGASKAEVKRAYYKLAKQFHPDTVGGDAKCNPTAAAKFAELTRAYEIICEDIMGCTVDEVTEDIVAVMDQRDVPAEDAAEPEGSSDDNPEKRMSWLSRFRRNS